MEFAMTSINEIAMCMVAGAAISAFGVAAAQNYRLARMFEISFFCFVALGSIALLGVILDGLGVL